MTKIIKSYRNEEERILNYVRNPLESMNLEDADSTAFVDPATILAEARALAAQKVEEAYAEGMRRGEAAGEAAFLASVGEAASVLERLTGQLSEERAAFLASLESQVLEVVRAVTKKILKREAEMAPEVVGSMVQNALATLAAQESVTIRVNPVDLEQIVARKQDLLEQFEQLKQLVVVPDEAVESGGCIAESEKLHIDARLTSQLNILIDRLLEETAGDA